MRIAVYGAGAIGGMLAVRLALAGHAVTVIDQGAHLDAIRRNGLKLVHADGSEQVARDLRAVDSCVEADMQDLVLLALKAYTIASVAPQMRSSAASMRAASSAAWSTPRAKSWHRVSSSVSKAIGSRSGSWTAARARA